MKRILLGLMLAFAPMAPVHAVQPDEVLADPGLEARARAISRNLRCPVCQGESIDDSNAPISRDLRLVVRERIMAGDNDAEVLDFVVSRYGEFVLFNPRAEGANLILWLAGPAVLLLGGIGAFAYVRRRGQAAPAPATLSAEEQARLRDLLGK
ncbi:cytochrome c-type biogenesis protein [Pseudorhodobacter sp. MZDSW-24AT]|uniref:cytochrome c-type biogenesis protein n=1 Tax=Pseudorhodobacter sp. MZDSW-24AT TaxID=2052957 RepID=UPI000C1E1CDD|nr:cytochrome c-type biogenesis protein [Pseudorhodobacter sp. MZDSW-24AT]PJF08165.1 cytochrome C biogenesis protein CcdA [Pseudorhodobacter sp. MZDSW-24AT]